MPTNWPAVWTLAEKRQPGHSRRIKGSTGDAFVPIARKCPRIFLHHFAGKPLVRAVSAVKHKVCLTDIRYNTGLYHCMGFCQKGGAP